MKTMTWEEFVKEVEKQLEENGIPKDTRMEFVDISSGFDLSEVHVFCASIGICIS